MGMFMNQIFRNIAIAAVFSVSSLSIVSCGGGRDTIILGSQESTVVPLYATNGANWNDYVSDDGADRFSASDTACVAATDTACLHGGQMMSMEVPDKTSCNGLTAADNLDVFEWECDDSVSPVRFVSTNFKSGKGLSDLIDFDGAAFLENHLEVRGTGNSVVAHSLPSLWWKNAIVVNNDGSDGSDMNPGEIHIITQNANSTYSIGSDQVALLVQPGVTLAGSTTPGETIISATNRNFIWLEGDVDGTGDNWAIYLNATTFSGLHKLTARNGNTGIYLISSSNNSLSDITVSGNSSVGLSCNSSSNISLNRIAATGNYYGILLGNGSKNILDNITATDNYYGVLLVSSVNNTLINANVTGNYIGVYLYTDSNGNNLSALNVSGSRTGLYLYGSSNNILNNITATDNSYTGISLGAASSNNSLSNITASGNYSYAIVLDDSSSYNSLYNIIASGSQVSINIVGSSNNNILGNITASGNNTGGVMVRISEDNIFSGMLQVGNNLYYDCNVSFSTNPGLVPYSCSDTGLDGSNTYGTSSSDAVLTTGVSVASSFVDPVGGDYSLLATDNVIRDVLNVPAGSDYFTHTWSDSTTTDLLLNAVEIYGDGVGNDNFLCESNETCIYTPNIAAYQGHGELISAGSFADGMLSGITLLKYETNGY